jgi:hypothetical protein
MAKPYLLILMLVTVSACSATNKDSATSTTRGLTGTLSTSRGPMQNAEVKLSNYADENCTKLALKQKLSPEEDQQLKQCSRQAASTTSDAQGKYAFPNLTDGWYSVQITWTTSEDPLKSNPMWKPIFLYRENDFLITFIAAKDSTFRMVAGSAPFQFHAENSLQKDLKLKL